MIFTIGARSLWRQALSPLLRGLYPDAAIPFLTQAELHDVLRSLEANGGSLRIRDIAKRERLMGSQRKFKTIREWTDEPLETVFELAHEHDVWFSSVEVQLGEEAVRFVVSRYGYIASDDRFDLLTRLASDQIAARAAERLNFFFQRDRQSNSDHRPRPLLISYDRDVFPSPSQTRKLVEVLRRFPHSTSTVLHGNPYLHVAVVDNQDYSSTDVWVMSSDRIILVPQGRSSDVALKRLVNHIFEKFREGELSAYQA
jgi:hypothetical protein